LQEDGYIDLDSVDGHDQWTNPRDGDTGKSRDQGRGRMQIDVNYRTEPPRVDGAYREEPEGSPKDFSVFSTKQISVLDILVVVN
jgi:hypothetical protein